MTQLLPDLSRRCIAALVLAAFTFTVTLEGKAFASQY